MARRHHHQPEPDDGRYDPTRDPTSEYYIDRGETSDTGEEVREHAERTADQQEEGDNWLVQLINRFTREGRVNTAYNQELDQQARELAADVNTRQPPAIPAANYLATPHPQLKQMVTVDVDPGRVGEIGDAWIEAGNAMTRFQSGVAAAINNSETEWQGAAGNAARTFMADVGNWVGNAGQSAQLAGTQSNIFAAAAAEANRAMPEPVEFDVAAANRDLQSTTNPIDMMRKYTTYMAQYQAQQDAHEQAARVLTTYDSSLAGASTMPAFAKPPQMSGGGGALGAMGQDKIGSSDIGGGLTPTGIGAGVSGVGGGSGGGSGGGFQGAPTLPGGGGTGVGSGGGSGGSGGGSGGGFGGGAGVPGLPGGGSTGPSGGGGFTNPPGGGGTGPFGPGGIPPGSTGPGGPNNVPPGGGPLPIGLGGGPGGSDLERGANRFGSGGRLGPGFGGPGGTGFGSGGGPGGSGSGFGGSGSGAGAGGSGAGGAAGAGRGGFGPGGMGAGGAAAAAEGAAMRGGVAGAAGRGGVGMGAVPGGRGQGDEDDEHQRPSFLVEGDPDAVFGTDEMTAPPVIGE